MQRHLLKRIALNLLGACALCLARVLRFLEQLKHGLVVGDLQVIVNALLSARAANAARKVLGLDGDRLLKCQRIRLAEGGLRLRLRLCDDGSLHSNGGLHIVQGSGLGEVRHLLLPFDVLGSGRATRAGAWWRSERGECGLASLNVAL